MKHKLLLLVGAALVATTLTSCYTDPFYVGGSVGTYRPYHGYSRGYSPYYRTYSPRSYGYPPRGSHHHHGHYPRQGYSYRGPSGHHHHHH